METDKLIRLFESADSINGRVALQLMEGLEAEQVPFSEAVLKAASLSVQSLLQEERNRDDFEEDTTAKEEIWNWVVRFRLPLAHTPVLLNWLNTDPERCLLHDLKETFPLIKRYSIDTSLPAFPIERIFECPNLEEVSFMHITLPITSVSLADDMSHLKEMWFYHCQAEPGFYSAVLTKSPHLTNLRFDETNFSRFPHEILQMPDLEQFVFLGNETFFQEPVRIPDEIGQLHQLIEFCFSFAPLVEFPRAVTQLTNLVSLVLRSNHCPFQIPNDIENLTKLETILLDENHFDAFPEALTRISSLKTVQIGKGLKHISPAISQLHQLTHLILLGVDFEELPESLLTLEKLEALWVRGNLRLPLHTEKFARLKQLNLSSCNIGELPTRFFETIQLEELNLSYNNLVDLTGQIRALTNLKRLELNYNRITQLPDELFELSNLQYLAFSGNPLSQLPPQLTKLKNLTILDLLDTVIAEEHVDIVRSWVPKAQVWINQKYHSPLENR